MLTRNNIETLKVDGFSETGAGILLAELNIDNKALYFELDINKPRAEWLLKTDDQLDDDLLQECRNRLDIELYKRAFT